MDTILFDLDGTLLPMDQDKFIDIYFKDAAAKLGPYGFEARTFIGAVCEGTKAMVENDGTIYNNERFWERAMNILGERVRDFEPVFLDYYKNEFQNLKAVTTPSPLVMKCINLLKEKGYRLILATNPLFPRVATYSRISWAWLEPEDFEWITTYENSSFCKPNTKYFEEIFNNTGVTVDQCIMIGNDVSDDMVVKNIGMDSYLVTDCLINSKEEDINQYKNGSFVEFFHYVKGLPDIS